MGNEGVGVCRRCPHWQIPNAIGKTRRWGTGGTIHDKAQLFLNGSCLA